LSHEPLSGFGRFQSNQKLIKADAKAHAKAGYIKWQRFIKAAIFFLSGCMDCGYVLAELQLFPQPATFPQVIGVQLIPNTGPGHRWSKVRHLEPQDFGPVLFCHSAQQTL
jgi:hypothetical protein